MTKIEQPTMATLEQRKIAKALGVDVEDESELVAAARIFDIVATAIQERPRRPSTDPQRTLAAKIGINVQADSIRVASARIRETLQMRNEAAARRLKLRPGTLVIIESEFESG